jgi:spore coat polysaccharide biosynthesis predicted glycosyltransferase SpsG
VGRGHLSRSLTLAETLVGQGGRVTLELTQGALDGKAAMRAERAGITATTGGPVGAIVVVDLPDLAGVERRATAERLAVFDDRDAFAGDAALVIQPSMPAWAGAGRAGRVVAGFTFAPVALEYVGLRDAGPAVESGAANTSSSSPPEVVVCFGGSDPALVTRRLGPAIAASDSWRTTVVVGADYAGRTDDLPPGVVRDPADLPARLARADLVVSGAGTMKFEVACIGRPAILLAVADDQLKAGPPFASTGAAAFLGDGRTVEPASVVAAVRTLLGDRDRRTVMGETAATVVDGRGAERLAAAILALAAPAPAPG